MDVYLKGLIKPPLELAVSRSDNKHSSEVCGQVVSGLNGMRPLRYVHKAYRTIFASLLDFQVAMESNPRRLGEDWPVQFKKVCLCASEQE